MVAFTAKTPSGAALFLYSGGSMARILPTGTLTSAGPVSYLSAGRPGLMADGTTAVLAGCARIPAIFRLTHQRLDLRIERGQLTPFGTELESLGDPVLTASGAMFVGATDTDDREKLYVLSPDDAFFEVGDSEFIYRIAMGCAEASLDLHRHPLSKSARRLRLPRRPLIPKRSSICELGQAPLSQSPSPLPQWEGVRG